MFHMLGRFAFTSSFSRRSSPGFPMGSNRFGFCCCERGLLNLAIISIPIHPLFAIQTLPRLLARPMPVSDPHTVPWRCSATLIWVRPRQSHALVKRRFQSPPPHPSRSASFTSLVQSGCPGGSLHQSPPSNRPPPPPHLRPHTTRRKHCT